MKSSFFSQFLQIVAFAVQLYVAVLVSYILDVSRVFSGKIQIDVWSYFLGYDRNTKRRILYTFYSIILFAQIFINDNQVMHQIYGRILCIFIIYNYNILLNLIQYWTFCLFYYFNGNIDIQRIFWGEKIRLFMFEQQMSNNNNLEKMIKIRKIPMLGYKVCVYEAQDSGTLRNDSLVLIENDIVEEEIDIIQGVELGELNTQTDLEQVQQFLNSMVDDDNEANRFRLFSMLYGWDIPFTDLEFNNFEGDIDIIQTQFHDDYLDWVELFADSFSYDELLEDVENIDMSDDDLDAQGYGLEKRINTDKWLRKKKSKSETKKKRQERAMRILQNKAKYKQERNDFFINKSLREGTYKSQQNKKNKEVFDMHYINLENQGLDGGNIFWNGIVYFEEFKRMSSNFVNNDSKSKLYKALTKDISYYWNAFYNCNTSIFGKITSYILSWKSDYFKFAVFYQNFYTVFAKQLRSRGYSVSNFFEISIGYLTLTRTCKDWHTYLLLTHQYVSHFYTDSIIENAIQACRGTNFDFTFLNGVSTTAASMQEQGWKERYESVRNTFLSMRNSSSCEFVSRFTQLFVYALKLGIIKSFKAKDFAQEILDVSLNRVRVSKTNAFLYFIETVFYTVDKVMEIIQKKSFSVLFSKEDKIEKAEMLIARCVDGVKAFNEDKMEVVGLTEHSLDALLEETCSFLHEQIKGVSSNDRQYFSLKFQKAMSLRNDFIRARNSDSLRERPFSFLLYGESGVGKSTMLNPILKSLYATNNFAYTEDSIVNLNTSDKYQSEYRSHHTTVVLDDIANVKPNFCQTSPLQVVIDIVNNQPKYALMPEADMKGKVAFRPKIVVGTTNIKQLQADIYSNNTTSILSRFEYIITIEVKPEFREEHSQRIDSSKVTLAGTRNIWHCTVQYAREGNASNKSVFHTVEYNGMTLEKIEIGLLIKFLNEKSKIFYEQQKILLERAKRIGEESVCQHNSFVDICFDCNQYQNQAWSWQEFKENMNCKKDQVTTVLKNCTVESELYKNRHQHLDSLRHNCDLVREHFPAIIRACPIFWKFIVLAISILKYSTAMYFAKKMESYADKIKKSPLYVDYSDSEATNAALTITIFLLVLALPSLRVIIFIGLPFGALLYVILNIIFFAYFFLCYFCYLYMLTLHHYYAEFTKIKNKIKHKVYNTFDKYRYQTYFVIVILYFIALLYYYRKAITKFLGFKEQGDISVQDINVDVTPSIKETENKMDIMKYDPYKNDVPITRFDIENIDIEPFYSENEERIIPDLWKKNNNRILLPTSYAGPTMEQLRNLTNRTWLAYAAFYDEDRKMKNRCNLLYIDRGCWLGPYHILSKDYKWLSLTTNNPNTLGMNHTSRFNCKMIMRVKNGSDLALVYVPSDAPRSSILRYIPEKVPTVSCAFLHYRDSEAVIKQGVCTITKQQKFKQTSAGINYENEDAIYYNWSRDTFKGLCGAVLIANSKFPHIHGIHLAGITDKPQGVSVSLTKGDLENAIDNIFQNNLSHLPLHAQGIPKLECPEKNVKLIAKPYPKSPIYYLEKTDVLKYYGSHTGHLRNFSSKVVDTLISDSVAKVFNHPNIYAGPKLINTYVPWYTQMKALTNLTSVDPYILEKASKDFIYSLDSAILQRKPLTQIKIISNDINLAGLDGVPGFEPINLSASAGWPYLVPKDTIIETDSERIVEGITIPRVAPDWVWEEVAQCEKTLLEGRRIHLIHRCNLKDEPTKITKEKVRVFAGTPLIGLLLVRKYFLSICKFIMENPITFECGVGVNPYSKSWTKLTKYMLKYGSNRVIAGDYKAFDNTMSSRMTVAGMNILIHIARKAGYSENDITIMQGLATELCYPLYEFNGDFVEVSGSNPSGHSLTVFLNNLVNSLYLRYAYYEMCPIENPPLFNQVVAVVCYGDDNKMSVKEGNDWFNHTSIANSLHKYGITYTMADKERESVPYISNEECNFLKRSSVWSQEYQCYLAPIEINTLFKILQSHRRSEALTMEEQSYNAIQNVLREAFFHGRETYQYFRNGIIEALKDHPNVLDLFNGGIYSYEDFENWFLSNYHRELVAEHVAVMDTSCDDVKLTSQSYDSENCVELDYQHDVATIRHYDRLFNIFDSTPECMPYLGLSPYCNRSNSLMRSFECDNCIATLNINNNFIKTEGGNEKETVQFHDGDTQVINSVEHYPDPTFMLGHTGKHGLEDFFERPIVIREFTWQTGVEFSASFNPWLDFITNPRVINRMNNFYLLHANLRLKFVLNGNPFYYGRVMVDYHPLYAIDTCTSYKTKDKLNIISASQRNHILLNPTNSKGGEMILPYLLNSNSAIVPFSDITENGAIHIRELQSLQTVNGTVGALSITVFAHMEKINLSIPTQRNSDKLVAQGDEYKSAPISNTASNVKKISATLTDVPVIGPYALATHMVANVVEGVAKIFGYSKPLILDNINPMRPQYFGRMACTNDFDNCEKLAFDNKQELSIDSRTVGLAGQDEMSIKYIAGIESYLTQFPWDQEGVYNQTLFSTRVRPNLHPNDGTNFYLPACAFAALPFKFWRGTMIFRFEIVCSEYHRGRLRVVYDPYGCIAVPESNTQLTRIIDIADTKEFTVAVGWAQPLSFAIGKELRTLDPGFRNGPAFTNRADDQNGVLSVYVLNELTVPGDVLAPIDINVYIKAGDDIEFAVPNETVFQSLHYVPQTQYEPQGDEMGDDECCADPISTNVTDQINDTTPISDDTYKVFMGEQIVSFRALLKRYNFFAPYSLEVLGEDMAIRLTLNTTNFPVFRGLSANGTSADGTTNQVRNTLLNYLAPAYLMCRGSLRSKYNIQNLSDAVTFRATVCRSEKETSLEDTIVRGILQTDADTVRDIYDTFPSNNFNGVSNTLTNRQPVLEVEFPYYSNRRFSCPKDREMQSLNYNPGFDFHKVEIFITNDPKVKMVTPPWLERWVSVGEDFMLAGFQGCPVISTVPL